MPIRLSGSAPDSDTHWPDEGFRRISRMRPIASGSANCSPEKPATKRPPRISPRASSRRYTRSRSRQGGSHPGSRAQADARRPRRSGAGACGPRTRPLRRQSRRCRWFARGRSATSGRRSRCRRRARGRAASRRRAACAEPTAPAKRASRRSCRKSRDRARRVRRAPARALAKQTRGIDQFVEEQRAARLEAVEHRLALCAQRRRAAWRRERHPERAPATLEQGDRRRADRRRMARAAVRCGGRGQSRPGRPPGETLRVEPRRLVPLEPSRKDLGLPCVRRRLESFERAQNARAAQSGPSSRVSSDTCCQANRKRRKSRAATGSISDRRRRTV